MVGRCGRLLSTVFLCSILMVALAACAREGEPPTTAPPLPTPDVSARVAAAVRDAMSAITPTPDASAETGAESERREQVAAQVRATVGAWPTQTPLPTHTPYPTPSPVPTATPTPTPTATPTATPTPTPVSTATPTPTPTPTATPTPRPDAYLSAVFDAGGSEAIGGEELMIRFTVTNESVGPASDARLAIRVNEPSSLLFVRSAQGTCVASPCDLGPLDGLESVTGHVTVLPRLGFDAEVRVEADVSWVVADSTRKQSRSETTVPLADDQPGALIWATSLNESSSSCGVPILVGPQAAYSGFGTQFYAVSRSSGQLLWFEESDIWTFWPALADGSIYSNGRNVETRDNYVRSLDSSDGTLKWQHVVDGPARGPAAVYGGSVFFTARHWDGNRYDYGYLMSLDPATGAINWRYRVDKSINTSAVEYGGNIYFGTSGSGDNFLYSIGAASGELTRRYRTSGGSYDTPLIADGNAYIVSGFGSIYSIDLLTGTRNWEYRPEGRAYETPVLYAGNIYIRVYDEAEGLYLSVHALDAATGKFKWLYRPGTALEGLTAADGSVYVPSYVNVVALDAETGSPIWQADYGTICSPLTHVDGVLYGRARLNHWPTMFAIRAR